jgi:hypothetical protein
MLNRLHSHRAAQPRPTQPHVAHQANHRKKTTVRVALSQPMVLLVAISEQPMFNFITSPANAGLFIWRIGYE